jgi:hypothetical protein
MEYFSEDDLAKEPYWDWKEKDWQQYLLITESQINGFVVLYRQLVNEPQRLDKIAQRMGWTAEIYPAEEAIEGTVAIPYTMHLHPVFILTRGIFRSLYDITISNLPRQNDRTTMTLLATLHEAETQAILGIESQDMGDMSLTVCHFKRSLAELNQALAIASKTAEQPTPGCEQFFQQVRTRIFDLREVWLRVNTEVRDEIQRRNEGTV